MIQRLFFVFCVIILVAGAVPAQRTVTNADLERYKQARLKADRDYRETYQQLGRPSPEELDRLRDEGRRETLELAERLRADRLEAERIEVERMREANRANIIFNAQFGADPYYYGPSGIFLSGGGFLGFRDRRFDRLNRRFGRTQQGYVGGGQFWPTGARTAARPMVRVRPTGPRTVPRPIIRRNQ